MEEGDEQGTSASAPLRERLPFLSWQQPSRESTTCFEQSCEYTLMLRCDSEEVEAVSFTLFDASTVYKSWCARTA